MSLSNQYSEGISISIYKSPWAGLTLSLQHSFSGPSILEVQPAKSGAVLEFNCVIVPAFLGWIKWWALLWRHISQTSALSLRYLPNYSGYPPLSLDLSAKANEKSLICHVIPYSCSSCLSLCTSLDMSTGQVMIGWRTLQPCLVTLTKQCSAAHPGCSLAEQTPGLGSTCGHPAAVSLWTATARPELDCRTASGCTFVFISCDSKSLGSPRTSVGSDISSEGAAITLRNLGILEQPGWWLSCLVLANGPLFCSEDDLLGSYCYSLLAGCVAETTAGIGRMAFLKSTGAADNTGVSNICLPPAHKICLKQIWQYRVIIAGITQAPAERHIHNARFSGKEGDFRVFWHLFTPAREIYLSELWLHLLLVCSCPDSWIHTLKESGLTAPEKRWELYPCKWINANHTICSMAMSYAFS